MRGRAKQKSTRSFQPTHRCFSQEMFFLFFRKLSRVIWELSVFENCMFFSTGLIILRSEMRPRIAWCLASASSYEHDESLWRWREQHNITTYHRYHYILQFILHHFTVHLTSCYYSVSFFKKCVLFQWRDARTTCETCTDRLWFFFNFGRTSDGSGWTPVAMWVCLFGGMNMYEHCMCLIQKLTLSWHDILTFLSLWVESTEQLRFCHSTVRISVIMMSIVVSGQRSEEDVGWGPECWPCSFRDR